jgi:hypothetical protein
MSNETTLSQQCDVQRWFAEAYSELLDQAAHYLIVYDAEKVLTGLSEQLDSCPATTQSEFAQWAGESVTRAAKLMAQFRDLYIAHQALVFDAIRIGLGPMYRSDRDFCRTVESDNGALMTANESAEELAAETWTEVLKKLGKFRPGKAKVTTWIYKIAWQKARSHMRQRTRRSRKESYLTIDDLIDQERQSLNVFRLKQIKNHL